MRQLLEVASVKPASRHRVPAPRSAPMVMITSANQFATKPWPSTTEWRPAGHHTSTNQPQREGPRKTRCNLLTAASTVLASSTPSSKSQLQVPSQQQVKASFTCRAIYGVRASCGQCASCKHRASYRCRASYRYRPGCKCRASCKQGPAVGREYEASIMRRASHGR